MSAVGNAQGHRDVVSGASRNISGNRFAILSLNTVFRLSNHFSGFELYF